MNGTIRPPLLSSRVARLLRTDLPPEDEGEPLYPAEAWTVPEGVDWLRVARWLLVAGILAAGISILWILR